MKPGNAIVDKSRSFGKLTARLVNFLKKQKCPYFFIDQIGRAGTSIGANVMEAEHAISRKEFLAKMYIAYKECMETIYWLDVLQESQCISNEQYQYMHSRAVEIGRILSSITKTTAERIQREDGMWFCGASQFDAPPPSFLIPNSSFLI